MAGCQLTVDAISHLNMHSPAREEGIITLKIRVIAGIIADIIAFSVGWCMHPVGDESVKQNVSY